ncbi:hypothetical protein F2Q69_00061380 [Brassica cretica]|uniref:Uncharacterized protein n=1 Tax=Brassica cretica TaxID=69181 RepID=A0A8S9RE43_BRACR|nr:hypothetical protein F2Q69_00061380 [Brassica cretica]
MRENSCIWVSISLLLEQQPTIGVSAGDSTLGVVFAAAQRSRPVVPRRGGETDEYMIFGRIGATGLFIRIFIWALDSVYSEEHDRSNRGSGDDTNTKRELKALQDKMDMLLLDRAKQEKVNFVGEQKQEGIVVLNEVDGLEGQEELCFINANGTWYKKEPNFQYNNYQQKPFYNNQQGGYQARQNYSQGFSSKGNQSTQGQPGSSTSAPQESNTDAMLKQILESQNRSEKHIGYKLKNLHTKVDGSYNDLNNKFSNLASNFKALENQFASMSCNSKRPMGSLPGTSEKNLKETMKFITLRSGKHLSPRAIIRNNEKQGGEVVINVDDDVVIVDEKTNEEILEKIVEVKGNGKVGEEKKVVNKNEVAT